MFVSRNKLLTWANKTPDKPKDKQCLIRDMHPSDLAEVWEMMKIFRELSPIKHFNTYDNGEFVKKQLRGLLNGSGVALVAVNKDEIEGFIVGAIVPTFWDESLVAIRELVFYTREEYRNRRTGYRLFQQYKDRCIELKQAGKVQLIILTDMGAKLDYSRFNCRVIDREWMLDD